IILYQPTTSYNRLLPLSVTYTLLVVLSTATGSANSNSTDANLFHRGALPKCIVFNGFLTKGSNFKTTFLDDLET
ncbi:MAG: hypothetical protein WCF97_09070, partial [Nitrososphaeraceae archaeon]